MCVLGGKLRPGAFETHCWEGGAEEREGRKERDREKRGKRGERTETGRGERKEKSESVHKGALSVNYSAVPSAEPLPICHSQSLSPQSLLNVLSPQDPHPNCFQGPRDAQETVPRNAAPAPTPVQASREAGWSGVQGLAG